MTFPNLGAILPDMGKALKAEGLADALFDTVMQRVLALLIGQPDRAFSTSELIRLAGSGTGAVHRLLLRLTSADLVFVTNVGNQKRYQANSQSPIFAELSGIVRKTVGLTVPIGKALAPLARRITAAFVFGSIAKKTDTGRSDIDLMVIGERISHHEILEVLIPLDAVLGRSVSPKLMTPAEWKEKLGKGNPFVRKVSEQPKLFIIGSEDVIA